MAKKFYLTVSQRKRIIDDLLSEKSALEADIEKQKPSQKIVELAEQANQERQMLVDLLKVGEFEED